MKEPVCPVLLSYISALRTELAKTPTLNEAPLEQLDQLEERVRAESSIRRSRKSRDDRAYACVQLALQAHNAHLRKLGRASSPALESLEAVQQAYAQQSEEAQAEAGEMGVVGVRNDGQQLKYVKLDTAAELAGRCAELAAIVDTCRKAPGIDGDLEYIEPVGRMLHEVCVAAKLPPEERLKFAEKLLSRDGQ
jgi:hypothetical protein